MTGNKIHTLKHDQLPRHDFGRILYRKKTKCLFHSYKIVTVFPHMISGEKTRHSCAVGHMCKKCRKLKVTYLFPHNFERLETVTQRKIITFLGTGINHD